MRYVIITSKKDAAGMTIKDALLKQYGFKKEGNHYELGSIKLYEVEEESIHCNHIDKIIIADFFIFATKHKSASGNPALTVHVPGNWAKAELGGKDRTLCIAPASLLKEMFIELNRHELQGYEKTIEAVHHGPEISKPAMFIEIGSTDEQWKDARAGEIIAKTIMNVLMRPPKTHKAVIAFGSTHYPAPFNKFLLRTDYAIGQICLKYMLEKLDKEMLEQAIKKNVEKVEFALLDWKGLGKHKEKVTSLLEECGMEYRKVQKMI